MVHRLMKYSDNQNAVPRLPEKNNMSFEGVRSESRFNLIPESSNTGSICETLKCLKQLPNVSVSLGFTKRLKGVVINPFQILLSPRPEQVLLV